MNIAGIDYTLKHQSIDIYVSGCRGPHCVGCHNKVTHCFDYGVPYGPSIISQIQEKIEKFPDLVKNFMIFGGEPLDQPEHELVNLLKNLKVFSLDIWLFTRYDISEIPESIKKYVDYIKTGRYDESLTCTDNIQYGITLSTSNQRIWRKGEDHENFI